MMRQLTATVLWVYDFLAEDLILLLGTALAIALVVLAVHTIRHLAGIILYATVVVVIAISLRRAAGIART